MNNRLEAIYALIDHKSLGVADIGTDHGSIPVQLALSGYQGNIIASDINELPLKKAIINAEAADVSERIHFIQSDGLCNIQPTDITEIVIAGMGGDLICKILDDVDWVCSPNYHFILQPMTKAEILRYWLIQNGFHIDQETKILYNGKLEQLLSVRFFNEFEDYQDYEFYIGKSEYSSDLSLYLQSADQIRARFKSILSAMNLADNGNALLRSYYAELIEHIDAFRRNNHGIS